MIMPRGQMVVLWTVMEQCFFLSTTFPLQLHIYRSIWVWALRELVFYIYFILYFTQFAADEAFTQAYAKQISE